MRLNLTERSVASLPAPDPSGKQAYHWDTSLKGFGVLCSGTSTAKTFVVQRDVGGRTRRVKIGAVSELKLAKAKERAAEALDDLRRGIDPANKADASMTLQAALDGYLDSRQDLRPESIRAYRNIERYLASWLNSPVRLITPEMVEKKHRQLGTNIGTTSANACMRTLRIVINYAAERIPDLPLNPVKRLKKQWFEERRRTRMLTEEQMPVFYRAVCDLKNEIVRDYLLLLMFCGFRKTEAAKLKWEYVDLKQRTITLPREITKGDRELALPICDFVADMLIARRALGRDRFIFPAPGKAGHVIGLQRPLNAIAKKTGIEISAHDLRRGFITIAESIGVPITVIKALVNHAPSRDVTSGYIVLTTERLREPVTKIAARITELCGISESMGKNVTKLSVRN